MSAVKHWIVPLLFSFSTFVTASLQADYDLDDTSQLQFPSEEKGSQFKIELSADWVGKAKFEKHSGRGHIRYDHAEAQFGAVVLYHDWCKEGLSIRLGYEYTRLDWDKNPFFKRKNYDTAVLTTVFFTERLCDWRWIATLGINFDADKWVFRDYTTYDMLLWGRYNYSSCSHLHLGLYAETGMKLDRVYPVIGFDWCINDRWTLNAVFPLNMSLVYSINDRWSVALAGRIFSDRHRAGKEGYPTKKPVWRYSNAGVELALARNVCNWLVANVHAGYTFGGHLKVANIHTHHSHYLRFKSSGYAGADLTINF